MNKLSRDHFKEVLRLFSDCEVRVTVLEDNKYETNKLLFKDIEKAVDAILDFSTNKKQELVYCGGNGYEFYVQDKGANFTIQFETKEEEEYSSSFAFYY